ncbi:MAG: hypothetical protein KDC05_14725 [Bacteroidales bacterium]|nr:hypothetical protein [Bacteroidales bacterium]
MAIFSKKIFKDLAQTKEADLSTCYIPTFREGDNEKARITFKNQVNAIKKELEKLNKGEKFIKKYLEPMHQLLDDPIYWRHLSDGLAVFRSKENFRTYSVPIHFEPFHYFGNEFYMVPLIPYFNGNGRFYLLAISQKKTRLYEGSKDDIGRIKINDKIPERLEDTVGYDFEEKSLQFRTERTGANEVQFHGHGAGKDDKNDELLKFLKDIDKGLTDIIGKSGKPLVIASVDEVFAKYKQVSKYKNIHPENISGNPDEIDILSMQEKSWDMLKDMFQDLRKDSMEKFERNKDNGIVSASVDKIVTAGMAGNIDTLFVAKNQHIWGTFDEEQQAVEKDEHNTPDNECLINKTVKATFMQGGNVFLQEAGSMPDSSSPLNALFRF